MDDICNDYIGYSTKHPLHYLSSQGPFHDSYVPIGDYCSSFAIVLSGYLGMQGSSARLLSVVDQSPTRSVWLLAMVDQQSLSADLGMRELCL